MVDAFIYVLDKIYRVRRFRKMLEELDAGEHRR
jgi:hypothetical protein